MVSISTDDGDDGPWQKFVFRRPDGSGKFWNIRQLRLRYMTEVHFGRLGTAGQRRKKSHPDRYAAASYQREAIKRKRAEGYIEDTTEGAILATMGSVAVTPFSPTYRLPPLPARPPPGAIIDLERIGLPGNVKGLSVTTSTNGEVIEGSVEFADGRRAVLSPEQLALLNAPVQAAVNPQVPTSGRDNASRKVIEGVGTAVTPLWSFGPFDLTQPRATPRPVEVIDAGKFLAGRPPTPSPTPPREGPKEGRKKEPPDEADDLGLEHMR